jgi:ribose-phosphate pyrophosphokinase
MLPQSLSRSLSIFAGSGSQTLATNIAKYLDTSLGNANLTPHRNGECMVTINDNVRGRDVFVVQSVCRRWLPSNGNPYTGVNDSLVELFVWVDALARSSAWRITAVIPTFGYARQDRKATGRTPISAKMVATCLEELGCNRVLTLDLHADQIQGFFSYKTKLDSLNTGEIVCQHFNELGLENAVVLSPDVGNLKKADKYRQGMPAHVELAVIDKRRRPDGTVESVRLIGDVKDRSVIMLDDIISTAGTMCNAMTIAMEHGAKDFYICATHGEFVGDAIASLNTYPIKSICITDAIPGVPEMDTLPIKILSVAELFGEAILRIHKDESISELLGKFS